MQRPWGRTVASVLEELQGSLYGWNQVGEGERGRSRGHGGNAQVVWEDLDVYPQAGETLEGQGQRRGRACPLVDAAGRTDCGSEPGSLGSRLQVMALVQVGAEGGEKWVGSGEFFESSRNLG